MIRRLRFLAALLALVSFSASFAETVWASMCPPMDAYATSTPGGMMGMPGMEMPESGADPSAPSEGPQDSRNAPDCPLTGVGTTGCHTVSVPGSGGVPAFVDITPPASVDLRADRIPHLLLVASHFRPPRA